jgi:hypothetical protein
MIHRRRGGARGSWYESDAWALALLVIPGRRAAGNPESIFQRPVFMDSGPSPRGCPGMTPQVGEEIRGAMR